MEGHRFDDGLAGAILLAGGNALIYFGCGAIFLLATAFLKWRDRRVRFFDAAALKRANVILGFGAPIVIVVACFVGTGGVTGRAMPAALTFGIFCPQTWLGPVMAAFALNASAAARLTHRIMFAIITSSAALPILFSGLLILLILFDS